MATASTGFHEPPDKLAPKTRDLHRAIVSLMEELEAIDWYQQRVEATEDPELKAILAHNRDEEKEHASMLLEWIRRADPTWDGKVREYLFSEGSIVAREGRVPNRDGASQASRAPAGLGSLRGAR